jgi:hypothetical protein
MTGEKPQALLDMPELVRNQSFYLDTFYTLSSWRGYLGTGDLAPLTINEVFVYCQMFEINSQSMRETLVWHIKRLDTAYLQKRADRLKEAKVDKPDT